MTYRLILSVHGEWNTSGAIPYHGLVVNPVAPRNVVISEVNAGALGWMLGEDDM